MEGLEQEKKCVFGVKALKKFPPFNVWFFPGFQTQVSGAPLELVEASRDGLESSFWQLYLIRRWTADLLLVFHFLLKFIGLLLYGINAGMHTACKNFE